MQWGHPIAIWSVAKMNARILYEITEGPNFVGGRESKVYALPRGFCDSFGEPCVVKLFTPHVVLDEETGLKRVRDIVELEDLADNEFRTGRDLQSLGLRVPRMHRRVSFSSPAKDHPHYNKGHRIPGVVMGEMRGLRSFRELSTGEHPKAIGSFVESIACAMYEGFIPFDTYHHHNAAYDDDGRATLFDFCQWRRTEKPATEEDVMAFLREESVLPESAWEMDVVI